MRPRRRGLAPAPAVGVRQAVPLPLERRRPPALLARAPRSLALGVRAGRGASSSGRAGDWGLPAAPSRCCSARSAPTCWRTARSSPPTWARRSSSSWPSPPSSALTERATWGRVVAGGAAFGAALATKFSALVAAAGAGRAGRGPSPGASRCAMALTRVRTVTPASGDRRRRLLDVLVVLAIMVLAAWLVIWAAYGFQPSFSADPAVNAGFDWERVRPDNPFVAEPIAAGAAPARSCPTRTSSASSASSSTRRRARPSCSASARRRASGTTSRSPSRSRRRWR